MKSLLSRVLQDPVMVTSVLLTETSTGGRNTIRQEQQIEARSSSIEGNANRKKGGLSIAKQGGDVAASAMAFQVTLTFPDMHKMITTAC